MVALVRSKVQVSQLVIILLVLEFKISSTAGELAQPLKAKLTTKNKIGSKAFIYNIFPSRKLIH